MPISLYANANNTAESPDGEAYHSAAPSPPAEEAERFQKFVEQYADFCCFIHGTGFDACQIPPASPVMAEYNVARAVQAMIGSGTEALIMERVSEMAPFPLVWPRDYPGERIRDELKRLYLFDVDFSPARHGELAADVRRYAEKLMEAADALEATAS